MIDDEDVQTIPFEVLEQRATVAEEKAKAAKKQVQATFATIASAALDVLSQRARAFFSLSLMATLFAGSMWEPSALRVAAATIFGGLLILAGMFKDEKKCQ